MEKVKGLVLQQIVIWLGRLPSKKNFPHTLHVVAIVPTLDPAGHLLIVICPANCSGIAVQYSSCMSLVLYSVAHLIKICLIRISGYFKAISISLPLYNIYNWAPDNSETPSLKDFFHSPQLRIKW